MPKIIENLESRLITEACRQIKEAGYGATTMRSIAKACGVGVGTVYNYFPSKDALLASHLLADWNECVTAINAVSTYSDSCKPVLHCIYDQLLSYTQRHQAIFHDEGAMASFAGSSAHYHALLRGQLAAPLHKFCENDFAADFIAESMLVWTIEGKEFNDIFGMLEKLL